MAVTNARAQDLKILRNLVPARAFPRSWPACDSGEDRCTARASRDDPRFRRSRDRRQTYGDGWITFAWIIATISARYFRVGSVLPDYVHTLSETIQRSVLGNSPFLMFKNPRNLRPCNSFKSWREARGLSVFDIHFL
jgi:hypothetical protein